jgi:hypothetical protein
MELLDRYLQAVKKHLPWQRQDDIIAELRANLESQLEDKEAELGRPLTATEAEAWIKQMGPPMQVAASYQPQRYLIGPGVFPMYWFVLRIACFWSVVIYSIVSLVEIFSGQFPSLAAVVGAIFNVPHILLITAAWVTLTFAVIELIAAQYPATCPGLASHPFNWTPGTLPAVKEDEATGKKPRSFAHAVAEVIFGFLFLAWLLLIPRHPFLLMGPGAVFLQVSPYKLAPIFVQIFWWLVALNVFQLAWRIIDLWRGSWRRQRPAQQIVIKALGLIPTVLLLTAPDHASIVLRHPALDQARYGKGLATFNRGIHQAFLFVCAIVVLQLVWEIIRWARHANRKRMSATS